MKILESLSHVYQNASPKEHDECCIHNSPREIMAILLYDAMNKLSTRSSALTINKGSAHIYAQLKKKADLTEEYSRSMMKKFVRPPSIGRKCHDHRVTVFSKTG